MNKGGVQEWLVKCESYKSRPWWKFWRKKENYTKEEIMKIAAEVNHTCLTCWWLQFKEGLPNRGCRYEDHNEGKLPFRMEQSQMWTCLGWRVDPEAKQRVDGFQGFIM